MAHTTNTTSFKNQKNVAAKNRQKKREELSPVQQLAKLDARPGNCTKERKRLTSQLYAD